MGTDEPVEPPEAASQPRPIVERKLDDDQARGWQFFIDALARVDGAGADQLHGEIVQAGIVADHQHRAGTLVEVAQPLHQRAGAGKRAEISTRLEAGQSVRVPPLTPTSAAPAKSPIVDPRDAEAIRERVRARAQLVDDGDYFAVLGVARDATGYEVRRAFLELRRAFDPSRMLTPDVADLAPEVRKITVVLEEAYEILKDTARRDRYRRAIEAVPDV